MTSDLITFYLDQNSHKKLMNEINLFHLEKNKSKLIKTIIINYFSRYETKNNNLKQKIKDSILKEVDASYLKDEIYSNIAWNITKSLYDILSFHNINNKKHNSKIKMHIRINKEDNQIDFILSSCPQNASISEYLANIIYSYLEEPQYEREKIIYKDIVTLIDEAIKNKQAIKIKTKSNKIYHAVPKELCLSKEEIYNYLLYQFYDENDKCYYANSIHLYNILDVHLEPESQIFTTEIEKIFERMKRNGIQFSIRDNTIYKVQLSNRGKQLFNLRYLERPVPLSTSNEEKGIYYFDCSELQFKSYFAPFFEDVLFLEPQKISDEIMEQYKNSIYNHFLIIQEK